MREAIVRHERSHMAGSLSACNEKLGKMVCIHDMTGTVQKSDNGEGYGAAQIAFQAMYKPCRGNAPVFLLFDNYKVPNPLKKYTKRPPIRPDYDWKTPEDSGFHLGNKVSLQRLLCIPKGKVYIQTALRTEFEKLLATPGPDTRYALVYVDGTLLRGQDVKYLLPGLEGELSKMSEVDVMIPHIIRRLHQAWITHWATDFLSVPVAIKRFQRFGVESVLKEFSKTVSWSEARVQEAGKLLREYYRDVGVFTRDTDTALVLAPFLSCLDNDDFECMLADTRPGLRGLHWFQDVIPTRKSTEKRHIDQIDLHEFDLRLIALRVFVPRRRRVFVSSAYLACLCGTDCCPALKSCSKSGLAHAAFADHSLHADGMVLLEREKGETRLSVNLYKLRKRLENTRGKELRGKGISCCSAETEASRRKRQDTLADEKPDENLPYFDCVLLSFTEAFRALLYYCCAYGFDRLKGGVHVHNEDILEGGIFNERFTQHSVLKMSLK